MAPGARFHILIQRPIDLPLTPHKVDEEGFCRARFPASWNPWESETLTPKHKLAMKESGRKPSWPAPRHLRLPPTFPGTGNKEKKVHTRTRLWKNEAGPGVSVLSGHGALGSFSFLIKSNFIFKHEELISGRSRWSGEADKARPIWFLY